MEVWCEEDALSGVIEPVCNRLHVRYMANKGYSSSSAMYEASRRFVDAISKGKTPTVIYIGDHDPSGMDMTRDIVKRLNLLTHGMGASVHRVVLNHYPISEYQPPPNPVKRSDSRYADYIGLYGTEFWELDALEPQVLDGLISDAIEGYLDMYQYESVVAQEDEEREAIRDLASQWQD